MKNLIKLLFIFLFACNQSNNEFEKPDNALDAGREFIQQSLQGKIGSASQYMLQDEDNKFWLNKWNEEFNKLSEQEKASYAQASIVITNVQETVPDSITVISFSNSYKKVPQKLKVVKYRGNWLVDFKHTFSEN